MPDFDDIARARASYLEFVAALHAGREIMRRAGVSDPPPIPEFDAVFHRLPTETRRELYAALREKPPANPADAIRLWQPLIRKAFGPVRS